MGLPTSSTAELAIVEAARPTKGRVKDADRSAYLRKVPPERHTGEKIASDDDT